MDQAIVHVVPTLHQYHAAAPGYGFDALTGVLERLRPDVLLVELTEGAARARRPQTVKREYQNSVFPYAQRHGVPLVGMEPDEDELFVELATRAFEAEREARERWPRRHAENEQADRLLFDGLFAACGSPAAFDTEEVERLIQGKHARDAELLGAACQESWERWNAHCAQAIAAAAQRHPGCRLLALAGIEHTCRLRPRLASLAQADGSWSLAPRLGQLEGFRA